MTTEEILKAAQKEAKDESQIGEFERDNTRRGILYASAVWVIICAVMTMAELIITRHIDFGKPAILFAFSSIANLYDAKKNNSKKEKIIGIIEAVAAIIFIGLYIGAFFR